MIDLSSFISSDAKQNLKKYLGIVKDLLFFFLKLIWIPVILAIIFGVKTHKEKSLNPSTYSADLSFIESSKLLSSSLPSISSYYGTPGTLSDESTSIISGILFSDAVIGKALFSPVDHESNELLINLYLRNYKPNLYSQFKFYETKIDSLNFEQKKIYKNIFNELTNKNSNHLNFIVSEIKTLQSTTKDENLSFALVTNAYNALVEFYETNQDIGYENTLELVKTKRDDALRLLKQYEAELAQRTQRGNLLVTPPEQLPERNLEREIQLVQNQYTNFYSQYEQLMASQSQKEVGYFRQLNVPIKPLAKNTPKVMKDAIIWGTVGFFAGLFLIFIIFTIIQLRKILKSIRV